MLTLVAIAALVLTVQAPAAGVPGNIQGVVCERTTCKPIPGARLQIGIPGVPASRKTAVTDFGGTFRFTQLPPGNYQIFPVEADNYAGEGLPRMVTLTGGGNVDDVKIEMRPLGTI